MKKKQEERQKQLKELFTEWWRKERKCDGGQKCPESPLSSPNHFERWTELVVLAEYAAGTLVAYRRNSMTEKSTKSVASATGKAIEDERIARTNCVLHMLVPVEARRRAKMAAVASGLSFRDYVTELFLQAQPLRPE